MKNPINNLHDALRFQLQGLTYAEEKIKQEFSTCSKTISSSRLKSEINKYIESADSKILKLERAFGYLLEESFSRKNDVINKLLEETHQMLSYSGSEHLKDILMISCIQNISAYKISTYKTAYLFAVELELDVVADLIQNILEWEIETSRNLSTLSIEEFNKIQKLTS